MKISKCWTPCDKGSFCDTVSGVCQTCEEVCSPIRNTPYLCIRQPECAETITRIPPAAGDFDSISFSYWSLYAFGIIAGIAALAAILLAVILFILYRRRILFNKHESEQKQCPPGWSTTGPVVTTSQGIHDRYLTTDVTQETLEERDLGFLVVTEQARKSSDSTSRLLEPGYACYSLSDSKFPLQSV